MQLEARTAVLEATRRSICEENVEKSSVLMGERKVSSRRAKRGKLDSSYRDFLDGQCGRASGPR